jgi:cyclopropane-fatty-acyl-phospholipid synthase
MFLLSNMLKRLIQCGTLNVIDASGKLHTFAGTPSPAVTIRLHNRSLSRRLVLRPELTMGEAYMDGTLTMEEGTLFDFLRLVSANRLEIKSYPPLVLMRRLSKMMRRMQQYNPVGSRSNVSHAYDDISEEMYRLFLDEDLQYTCAFFREETDSLEQAQHNKQRLIASKLQLKKGQKVLELGCGWGGLAFYLAKVADVHVTGVTLSTEQLKVANERARALGLEDRVDFQLCDARKVEGRFDRIVSVGMFEHIGQRHYAELFARIHSLLADDGIALLHSIGRKSPPGTSDAWLRKYIFPGGYSPALSEVFSEVEQQGLWVTDVEILRLHYAQTLREWRKRFEANRKQIESIYDERFGRMWEFYLVCVEMAFSNGNAMVFQMQLARSRDAVPLTRDYIFETERAYIENERTQSSAEEKSAA